MKSLKEAFDNVQHPNLFHSTKQAKYDNPSDVEKLMPDLGPNAQRYIKIITSDAYNKAVERLVSYTGVPAENHSVPSMLNAVMSALRTVSILQLKHTQHLEKLAVDIVLSLPEFKMFKGLIDSGKLKIVAKLQDANLDNAITETEKQAQEEPEDEDDLTIDEIANEEMAVAFDSIDEQKIRRQFARMVTQGNAINKLYLFQMASDSLDKIDKRLVKLYGIMSSIVQMSYYAIPDMPFTAAVKNAAVGSVEVKPEDEVYTINANSPFFPYLIHEIVKGLWEYLSMDIATDSQLADETLDQETMEVMSGPQLYTNIVKLMPQNKMEYLPLTYKLLLRQPSENIKTILAGGGKAQNIVAKLAHQAEEMMNNFEQGESEENV